MHEDPSWWLVKSNGRILGPFRKFKIFELLKEKEIVLNDEVSSPMRRWQFILEHPEFAEIAEEVRKLNFGSNEDKTFTMSVHGQTQSITDAVLEERTVEVTTEMDMSRTQEIVITDLEEEVDPNLSQTTSGSQFISDVEKERFLEDSSPDWTIRALWAFAVLTLVSVGAYVYFYRGPGQEQMAEDTDTDHLKVGIEYYYSGDYMDAIEPLRKALEADPTNQKVMSLLAPALIQKGPEEYVFAQEILDALQSSEPDEALRVKGLLAQGLLYLKQGEIKKAEGQFEQAAKKDPFSWQAMTNLGTVAFQQAEYPKARNFFATALEIQLERDTSRGEAHLMLAQSQLEEWRTTSDKRYLDQAGEVLRNYLNEYSDYRQEALLLLAFAQYAKADYVGAEKSVDELIDTDPFLTAEHAKSLLVYRDHLEWTSLLSRCQNLVTGMESSSHLETLHALCLIQTRSKDVEAKEVIRSAINQAPQDPLVQGVYAFVNWNLGSEMKAELLATKAIEMNNTGKARKLPHIIKARICESLENYECSLSQWKTVQEMDKDSISALGGVSVSHLALKQFSRFEMSYQTAKKYSRFYKPLLRAQVKASKEGIRIRQ